MSVQSVGKIGYSLTSLVIGNLAPLIAFFAIRSSVSGDTKALAIAWLISVVWTLGSSTWLKRLAKFPVLGVVAYGIALFMSVFFRAGALPLKLHHAVIGAAEGSRVYLGGPLQALLPVPHAALYEKH